MRHDVERLEAFDARDAKLGQQRLERAFAAVGAKKISEAAERHFDSSVRFRDGISVKIEQPKAAFGAVQSQLCAAENRCGLQLLFELVALFGIGGPRRNLRLQRGDARRVFEALHAAKQRLVLVVKPAQIAQHDHRAVVGIARRFAVQIAPHAGAVEDENPRQAILKKQAAIIALPDKL